MKSNFRKIIKRMTKDFLQWLIYFIEEVLPKAIDIIIPFIAIALGEIAYSERGYFAVGGEVFLVVALELISLVLKKYAKRDRLYNEFNLPVPTKRFTYEVGDGEVQVDVNRVQEMILFVADVEDWLEDNGLTRVQEDD